MKHLLFLIAAATALGACGKFSRIRPEETSVSLAIAGPQGPGAAVLAGGMMVYAIRVGNPQSKGAIHLANESEGAPPWLIPNGNYDFLAFGYSASNMGGVMYCGKAVNVPLSGGATTVSIALDDNGVCGNPPFSPPNYGTAGGDAPLILKLASCSTDGDIATVAVPSAGCGTGGSRPSHGNFETVKFSFPSFNRWNPSEEPVNKGPGLQSGCIMGPFNGGGTTIAGKLFPMGPFAIQLETYSVSACTGFMGAYTFMHGMAAAHENSSIRFIDGSNNHVFPSGQMGLATSQPGTSSYLFVREF